LGVLKRLLLNSFIEATIPYKLSKKIINETNLKILNIRYLVTKDVPRKPRTLKEIRRWKGVELRHKTFSDENTYTEPGSMFTVTKFRQVRASRGARIGGVEWAVAFNDFNFQAELQK
jgi:hypothetical protein